MDGNSFTPLSPNDVQGRPLRQLLTFWGPMQARYAAEFLGELACQVDQGLAAGYRPRNLTAETILFREDDGQAVVVDWVRETSSTSAASPLQELAALFLDLLAGEADLSETKTPVHSFATPIPEDLQELLRKAFANDREFLTLASFAEKLQEIVQSRSGEEAPMRRKIWPMAMPLPGSAPYTKKGTAFLFAWAVFLVSFILAVTYLEELFTERYGTSLEKVEESPQLPKSPEGVECPPGFAYIPPGKFLMGVKTHESPLPGKTLWSQHEVLITKGFCIGQFEVTQHIWEETMGTHPSHFLNCGKNCPVEQVSYHDIQEFLERYNALHGGGYRLPTSAEWEYAARAGTETSFFTGNLTETGCRFDRALDKAGWYCGNSRDRTHPCGEKAPNAWGLYDVHGNVSEMVEGWYTETYPNQPEVDPQGPPTGEMRACRGGDWIVPAIRCTSGNVFPVGPKRQHYGMGFRLVRDPQH